MMGAMGFADFYVGCLDMQRFWFDFWVVWKNLISVKISSIFRIYREISVGLLDPICNMGIGLLTTWKYRVCRHPYTKRQEHCKLSDWCKVREKNECSAWLLCFFCCFLYQWTTYYPSALYDARTSSKLQDPCSLSDHENYLFFALRVQLPFLSFTDQYRILNSLGKVLLTIKNMQTAWGYYHGIPFDKTVCLRANSNNYIVYTYLSRIRLLKSFRELIFFYHK